MTPPPGDVDFRAYEVLRRLGGLYLATVDCTHGTLLERAAGVLAWRSALLKGGLPSVDGVAWPAPELRRAFVDVLGQLGLARFCRGNEALTDAVMQSLLDALKVDGRDLEALTADLRDLETLQRQAAAAAEGLRSVWEARVRAWCEAELVLGDISELLGRGWDRSLGFVQASGWQEALRLTRLLADVPQLRNLARRLGREQSGEAVASATRLTVQHSASWTNAGRPIASPRIPGPVRGLERSGDVSRMLPSEAVLLVRPATRGLWHARRLESGLMSFKRQGEERQRTRADVETRVEEVVPEPEHRAERGPVIVCLDTSGSMHGGPETVAKAVLLEVLRVARSESRPCYVYTFSGPGQVRELEIGPGERAVHDVLDFLSSQFTGGTDVEAPLRYVVERLKLRNWRNADVLLVTDGEFPVDPSITESVDSARKDSGARFFGLLVGGASPSGLGAFCDTVERFTDWENPLEIHRVDPGRQ